MNITKLSTKGQIVIPEEIRRDIETGTAFIVSRQNDLIVLKPVDGLTNQQDPQGAGARRFARLAPRREGRCGYSLARGPEEISVADVIKALQGPLGMTECASMPGSCDQESVCPIRSRWQEISQTVVDFLARIRLTDLATSTPLPPMVLALGSRPAQGACRS